DFHAHVGQLKHLHQRAELLSRALRSLYASLASFASAALISVIGSALAFYQIHLGFQAAALIGSLAGVFAVGGLVTGCVLMVRETRVALETIAEEARIARAGRRPGGQRSP